MTIDKAIEILELRVASPFVRANQDTKDAIKLGIEALKAVKKFQSMGSKINPLRLRGETIG